jgi:SnoaL-like domain
MYDEDRVRELADKDAIRELLHLYCVGSDRMDTALVESVFHADARLHYGYFDGGPRDLSAFSMRFLPRFVGTHHSLTNIIIRLDGQSARSLSYITALHSGGKRKDGSRYDMIGYGRYADLLHKHGGQWRIIERTVLFDGNLEFAGSFDWPEKFSAFRGRRDPSDPSYQIVPAPDIPG